MSTRAHARWTSVDEKLSLRLQLTFRSPTTFLASTADRLVRPQYFMRASVLKRMTQIVSFSLKRRQLFMRLNLHTCSSFSRLLHIHMRWKSEAH